MKKETKGASVLPVLLVVMALWGSLFPAVKMSYSAFGVDTGVVGNLLCYAALRFMICGAILTAIALARGEKLGGGKACAYAAASGLFSTALHYAFTYVGLSLVDSSKTAIMKQVGTLLYVCFSFLFIKGERFRAGKIIGAAIGFLGIIAIDFDGGGFSFSVGDGLILAASVCTVAASLFAKKATENMPPMLMTGTSQLFGGLILAAAGAASGGSFPVFTAKSVPIFVYICAASMIAYCLWHASLAKAELSGMFIVKFAEPVFAAVFGMLLLSEDILKWNYFAAFVLISAGIAIAEITGRRKKETA